MFVSRCSYARSASVSATTWLTSIIARVDCRLRANVSRLRTIRAARSASPRMTSTPRRGRGIEGLFGQALGPAQDRRERVVQLVGDAGNRLSERRHLFRLQQLLVQVARLVVDLLALADVADERLDAHAAAGPSASARAVTSTQTGEPSTRRMRSR